MSLEPFECVIHGKTKAYVYLMKKGVAKGRWRRTCVLCRKEEVHKQWQEIKIATIKAYGGKCECCGEVEPRFLTIDHKNGNGKEHRKSVGRGWRMYLWLAKQGFPKDDYRLLCYNCNCARGQYGRCPHEEKGEIK